MKTRKESPDQFREFVNQTPAFIYFTTKTGKFTFVNPAFTNFTGYSERELLKKTIFQLIPKEYLSTIKKLFNEQIKNQHHISYNEFPILTKSRKIRWLGQNTKFIYKQNKPILYCVAFDITIRRIVDQETLTLSKIIDQTQEMVVVTDKEGYIQYVNSAFEKITGYTKEEAIGKKLSILNPDPSFDEKMLPIWDQVLQGKSWHGIIKNRKKNGTLYDEELTITPIYDDYGNLINITEIKRDITNELKQKTDLLKAEAKYKSIFDNAIEGIYQTSIDGKIITANKALLDMLGYDNMEEFLNLDATSFYVNPDDRKAFKTIMDKDGKVIDYELRLRRKDGKEITVVENARAVKDYEGNILYYEGMIQDITKRKEDENAIRLLNAQKDKFLSIISHDLRAPFNSILGFTEMLLDETVEFPPEEKKEFLSYIKHAAEQQLRLLNNLLDWSRLETGRIRFEPRPLNLKEITESVMNSLMGNAHRKNIELTCQIPDDITINADLNLIQQLLSNLIGNAIKFTPQNGKVWIKYEELLDKFVKISVNDTGIGIPEADIDKLFRIDTKYFTRGTEGEEGSGLGLALCSEIIQKHGGEIYVESQVNKGSSFYFTLPAVKRSILIVDDNRGDRQLTAYHIQEILPDFLLYEAYDGYEAMSIAISKLPSIILADFAMPGMDGLRMIKELKTHPETCNIPVIIVTSHESKADAAGLIEHGVKEILLKPINKEELQKAVLKYI